MENNKPDYVYNNVIQLDDADASRKFIANVFTWMFAALAISAVCAYVFANTPSLLQTLVDPTTGQLSGLAYIVMFAPLAFVMLISFGLNRISYPVLSLLFIAYAALTGISLSFILMAFTAAFCSKMLLLCLQLLSVV